MLLKYGTDEIRANFLAPMVSGQAIPGYGMSEPESSALIPVTIKTSARLSNET